MKRRKEREKVCHEEQKGALSYPSAKKEIRFASSKIMGEGGGAGTPEKKTQVEHNSPDDSNEKKRRALVHQKRKRPFGQRVAKGLQRILFFRMQQPLTGKKRPRISS